jgi:uncharacterized protein
MYATPEQKRSMETISALANGLALFWSPSWLGVFEDGKVLPKRTYDSSSTPEPGKVAAPPRLAPVDLDRLTAEMQASTDEVKSNDPKELKKEIVRLKEELARKGPSSSEESRRRKLVDDLTSAVMHLERVRDELADTKVNTAAPVSAARTTPLPKRTAPVARQSTPGLNDAQARVLRSLYWLRNEQVTPIKVAFYANYTVNGHFNNLMGQLRKAGLVDGWQINQAGIAHVPDDVMDKPTGSDLRDWVREKIGGAENKILDVLMAARGQRVPVDRLASDAGYTVNGHFTTSLGKLRTLQIAEGGARDGGVKAADLFFS